MENLSKEISSKSYDAALDTVGRLISLCPLYTDLRIKRADIYHEKRDFVMAVGDIA
jgi:hypothetical protein